MTDKICWDCKHIWLHQADPGYSEYTPGSDFSLNCNKNVWDFDSFEDTLDSFRTKLLTAQTCQFFEQREVKSK